MARYRIVCTDQEPASHPTTQAHIVSVGTGDNPDRASEKMTLTQVLQAMDRGDIFYTKGATSGRVAEVEKWRCAPCQKTYIKSKGDTVQDNNLDSLRRCAWT